MPHKHKRKRDEDVSNFDLAPNSRAKPLPAYTKASIFSKEDDSSLNKRRKPNKSNSGRLQDDTPKAFARLMAWQAAGKKPKGLDDGTAPKSAKKQRKKSETKPGSTPKEPKPTTRPSDPASTTSPNTKTESKPKTEPKSGPNPPSTSTTPAVSTAPPPTATTNLKILPGETLSSFALRVDQTLSLSSLTRTPNATLPADLQASLKKSQRTTKHNKRLQKMQADWRADEAKLREKETEEAEDLEDHNEEETLLWAGVNSARTSRKGKKKKAAAGKDIDDDPWKELEKKRREETKQKNLQDVVKAPPTLKKVKSKFKARPEDFEALDGKRGDRDADEDVVVDVGNVPNKMGSLRRREELNATRRAVIEGYRRMNGRKRGVSERLEMSRPVMA